MNRIAVVITDFNGFARTRLCLAALQAANAGLDIILVDHGTDDGTQRGLAAEFPGVTRLKASPDLWWTGATNRGVELALARGASAVMLLNNDCYFAEGALAELLARHAEHPAAIVAPVQCDLATGAVLTVTARSLFLLGFPSLKGSRRLEGARQARGVVPTPLIMGGRGAIIPAQCLREVGAFDEAALPHYGADHDFYLRARRHGVELLVATRARVLVDNSSTTLADDPGRLTLAQFRETLVSVRSHHNLRDVGELFRRHYPVPGLGWLGAWLYTGRYALLYLLRRLRFLMAGPRGS